MKERFKDLSDTLLLIMYFFFRLDLGIKFLDFEGEAIEVCLQY